MRKLFSKRIFILAITLITCFSSITAFSQDFVFANESETTSSETVLVEAATLSGEASTEAQETENESQSETAESENDSQTEATEDTTESEATYLEYDDQPTTMEEVQAWIDAYTESGYSFDAKPHWQYEVDSSLMPSGWRCDYVEDENYSEGKYWTIFPKPVARALSANYDVYETTTYLGGAATRVAGFGDFADAVKFINAVEQVTDVDGNSVTGTSSTNYTIVVNKADTTLTEMQVITNPAEITLTTDTTVVGSKATIERTSTTTSENNTRHFKVESGSKLILENIILKGNWDGITDVDTATGGGGVWVESGELVLETGAEITKCYRANITISGVSTGGTGGAVYVNKGTFTMNGGNIHDNFSSGSGGGVHVGDSSFDFSNNSPGSYIDEATAASKFYMYGGTIKDNTASNTGGGVSVKGSTYFEMSNNDPAITGNTTYASSGGVAVEFSTFVLVTGSITDNKATAGSTTPTGSTKYNSGGVGIVASKFTMSGGSISDNSAMGTNSTDPEGYGGGVWVGYAPKSVYDNGTLTGNDFFSEFTMTKGEISANYATRSGGGVLVVGGSTFDMSGGEIYNNETGSKGGGVTVSALAYYNDSVEKPSTFNMSDGKIYGNFATNQGGGVAVNASDFTMSGGDIYGNATTDAGGGVWVGKFEGTEETESTFTMRGGTIGNASLYSGTTGSPIAADAQNAGASYQGNYATSFGGGVFVGDGTTFTMSGNSSVQSNKTSSRAGGIGVKRSYFEMSDNAAISSNYASLSGGGVSVASSTFYMRGGTIDGDNTGYSAGGVRVGYDTEAYNDANGNATEEDTLETVRKLHGDTSYFYMTGGDITGNEATYCGGGVIVRDGAEFYMGSGSYDHDNKKFTSGGSGSPTISKNNAHYAGGGVFLGTFETRDGAPYPTFYKDSAKFYMYDGAVIDDNRTEWVTGTYGQWLYGGGVHVNWGSEFEMNGGDIINNTAAYCGGGVSVAGATFTMKGGNISGNSTKTSYNNPSGTDLVAYGGGVWIGHAYTMDEDGDGVYGSASHPEGSMFTMTGGIIGGTEGYYPDDETKVSGGGTYYGNHAEDDGGGVYVGGNSQFIMKGDAQINYNDTTDSGGGVYVGLGDFGTDENSDGIADSSFIMESGYILNNKSDNDGGGLYLSGVEFTLNDGCYISGNKTTTKDRATAGGIFVEDYTDGDGNKYEGKLTIAGGLIGGTEIYTGDSSTAGTASEAGGPYYGNYAAYYGGGICAVNADITMTGGSIANNTSYYLGGGVFLFASNLTMENAEIRKNNVTRNNGGGVAMFTTGSHLNVAIGGTPANTIFSASTMTMKMGACVQENKAPNGSGGGILNYGTLTMEDGSLVDNNAAGSGGGGIDLADANSNLIMQEGSVVSNNTAVQGGGVYVVNGLVDMKSGASITDNKSTGSGGGIHLIAGSGSGSTFTNTLAGDITNNTAGTYGGGISISGATRLTIYNITGTISGNTAKTSGGGIYFTSTSSNTTVNVSRATVTANRATDGGGIYSTNTSVVNVSGADITANMASNNGGGIYANSTSRVLTVSDSTTIANNVALYNGGGIYTSDTNTTPYSNLSIKSTTIFDGNRSAYATEIDSSLISNYSSYVSDAIIDLSVYTYALNNYDINYAATPSIYTIILDPNGGTFEGSVENLGYLYVAAANVAKPLEELGYVIDSSTKVISYDANSDNGNANAVGLDLVNSGVAVAPTKDGSNLTMWTTDSTNLTTLINLATTAYYSAGAVGTDLAISTGTSATAPSIYAQWVTYSITLALDDGITWTDLADNVAVTFENTVSNASMTVLFTDPSKKPGNYYTIYPEAGALNGIQTLGDTDTWNVTADLPLSGQYYIKGITIDNGTVSGTSVSPTNAESCVIVITIGKTATPWGHWIYTSQ